MRRRKKKKEPLELTLDPYSYSSFSSEDIINEVEKFLNSTAPAINWTRISDQKIPSGEPLIICEMLGGKAVTSCGVWDESSETWSTGCNKYNSWITHWAYMPE